MLRSSRVPTAGRRIVAASVVTMSAILAACSDASTAPETPSIAPGSERPSSVILALPATVTVRMVDTTGATLKEPGWIHFSTSVTDTMSVLDNTAKDLDPTVGVIKVKLSRSGTYKACFGRSQHYMPDVTNAQKYPYCRTVSSSASVVDMGTVIGQRSPMFVLITKNQFGTLVGGATFDFFEPATNWDLRFTDGNGSYDESAGADGVVIYTLNFPFVMQICELTPPPKTALTSAACQTVDAKWGKTYTYTFYHEAKLF